MHIINQILFMSGAGQLFTARITLTLAVEWKKAEIFWNRPSSDPIYLLFAWQPHGHVDLLDTNLDCLNTYI